MNHELSSTNELTGSLPRSVYVHIPFCRHRCGYCNFSLVAGRDHLIQRFLNALQIELRKKLGKARVELDTLFLGGGTPSHLSVKQLDTLFEMLREHFDWSQESEVTVECNPNDLDESKAEKFSDHCVNRVSLGVQSLHPGKLTILERDHDPRQVETAVQLARSFATSVSIDLIFASPGESKQQWFDDLNAASDLNPDHISSYELTFEKGTSFWNRLQRKQLSELDEDLKAEMYEHTLSRLRELKYEHYEVSSFARRGHRCRHNQVYWSGESYLAFGPSASQFVGGVRETNHRSPTQYMKRIEAGKSPVEEREQLTGVDAAKERLAIGLRRLDGVEVAKLESSTGYSIETILGEAIHGLLEHRLVEFAINSKQQAVFRLTEKGVMLGDGVASLILK